MQRAGFSSGSAQRWCVFTVGVLVLLALLAFEAQEGADRRAPLALRSGQSSVPVARHAKRGPDRRTIVRSRTRSIHLISGASIKHFVVSEPAGVIRLLRVTVPHGTRENLLGAIPRLASVRIWTSGSTLPAADSCQRHGAADVCTEQEEACPMPAATWRFALHKLTGPAGDLRLEFVIGYPPHRSTGTSTAIVLGVGADPPGPVTVFPMPNRWARS